MMLVTTMRLILAQLSSRESRPAFLSERFSFKCQSTAAVYNIKKCILIDNAVHLKKYL